MNALNLVLVLSGLACSRPEHQAQPWEEPQEPEKATLIPRLKDVALQVGDRSLKPKELSSAWRWQRRIGGLRLDGERRFLRAFKGDVTGKPDWQTESADLHFLLFMTATEEEAFFLGYSTDDSGNFKGFDPSRRIRRLDLATGSWNQSIEVPVPEAQRIMDVVEVKADAGDVAILSLLGQKDAKAADEEKAPAGYQVTCFRKKSTTPLWSMVFPASESRAYSGVYLWGIPGPRYANSTLQRLSWMGERLIVCAEARQPIMALSRDSGRKIWHIDRPWEFERGFIGPSVYSYYLGRFGLEDDRDRAKEEVGKARKEFDERYEGSIAAGPVILPLPFERDNDTHSLFVAVLKGPRRGYAGLLSDCLLYEFNERGLPVSMAKLPQVLDGSSFQQVKDGVVWSGHNDSIVKAAPSRRLPRIGMGGGGPDGLSRIDWLRQVDSPPISAWLRSDRWGSHVAFTSRYAFLQSGGGYIEKPDSSIYRFPLAILNLATGQDRAAHLDVPFKGACPEPSTNFSKTRAGIHTSGPYLLAVTQMRAEESALEITLGMEKWSATLRFDLRQENFFAKAEPGLQEADPKRRILALGDVNQRDEIGSTPLMSAAHEADSAWVRALLEAGADPKAKSKFDWTALMVAAIYGTGDVVDLLIAANSDLEAADNNCGGQTVLIWATRSERESRRKVQALLKAGAQVNRTTPGGCSPLISAVDSGNLTTVEFLISSGARVNDRDKGGNTALHYAQIKANPEIVNALKAGGGTE